MSDSNNVCYFCADRMSVETEKMHLFNCNFDCLVHHYSNTAVTLVFGAIHLTFVT